MNSEERNDFVVDDTPAKEFNYDSVNVTDKQLGMRDSSNIVTGLIGAIIGSLIGVAVWVAIYYFGYIASIAGFVIVFGALKGYALLGGMLDKKGVVVVVLVSLAMVFVANHLAVTFVTFIDLKDHYQVTFMDTLDVVNEALKLEEVFKEYISDLVVGYLFTILGAASMIVNEFKRQV